MDTYFVMICYIIYVEVKAIIRPEGRQVRLEVKVDQDWTSTRPSNLDVQLMQNGNYIRSFSFPLQPYTWLAGCSQGSKINGDVRKTLAHQMWL